MKKTFALFLILVGLQSMAQGNKMLVHISAQGCTIDASLENDNPKKMLTLTSKKTKDGRLVIMNLNVRNEADYKRSYLVMNDKDEELPINIVSRVNGSHYVLLKDFFANTQKGNTYKLYTMAVPKDPNAAATVRVRRILLCSIAVK